MIDRVIAWSIGHRWLVVIAALVLILWGAWAAFRTPIDAIPDLSENQVIVFTEWSGHGPREIEDQISYPLSLELKGLDGVRAVRSSSDTGFSSISVVFEEWVNWAAARRQVADALAQSTTRWPSDATPRIAPDAPATGQIFWYTVEGKGYDPGRLRAVQDWYVRPLLATVPGVAEVASVGGMPLEYHVDLDPQRLKARGATATAVADAVRKANAAVGSGGVLKGNAEYLTRGVGWLGARPGVTDPSPEPQRVIRDLENVTVPAENGTTVALSDVARVTLGSGPRRGILEKDGGEAVGGVVLMKHGENPLEVTRRLRAKIQEFQRGLPPGVRVVSVYDRTPLIRGVIGTVTNTLLEAILTATICILIVLRHARSALAVAITLPLAVLFSFGLMDVFRRLGVTVETNLMSLAGLAISIGVLVDSAIVVVENVMHRLKSRHGEEPVKGDTRADVLAACLQVGRPIAFSVLILFLSFLPVFALGGMEGKMFHPLAFTKSFAMLGVGLLSVTLVPALCTFLIRGSLKSEQQVRLVHGLIGVYRPLLAYLLDRPVAVIWVTGLTFVLGTAPLGVPHLLPVVVACSAVACIWSASRIRAKWLAAVTIVLVGLCAERGMPPLPRQFITPLDEGMAMDMPITVPRMSATQAADDLLARDMILCRFPEVEMVVGKAGRAETATDPAPLDMIETMVGIRPREFWPRRCLSQGTAEAHAFEVLEALIAGSVIRDPGDRVAMANAAAMTAVPLFDAQMREAAYQRNKEFERDLGRRQARFTVERLIDRLASEGALAPDVGGVAPLVDAVLAGHVAHLGMEPTSEAIAAVARDALRKLTELGVVAADADLSRLRPGPFTRGKNVARQLLGGNELTFLDVLHEDVLRRHRQLWQEYTVQLNADLLARAPGLYTRLVLETLLEMGNVTDARVAEAIHRWHQLRSASPVPHNGGGHHHSELPFLEPVPAIDTVQATHTERLARTLRLVQRDRVELAGFGGEMDRAVQMPGWTNVWTMPIQNRVDMLATGVNTTIGVRVLGRRTEDVVRASEEIALLLKTIPGAADVIADPVRGKGYLEIVPDRVRAARLGVDAGAVIDLVEIAVGGRVVTHTVEGRERFPVRVRFARAHREDEEEVRSLPVPAHTRNGLVHVPLAAVADVRITEGTAVIKGENGLARNYVRLNVRGRDVGEFVAAAQQAVATRLSLPDGVFVEWTGQFEHELRANRTLVFAVPVVVGLIFVILWWTYHDLTDAGLILVAVPGALAGGVLLQWLLGYPLSVAAWVGFISCFGMATSTGVIMLVYLRQAVSDAGGIEQLTPETLKIAVMDGAAHRLRPKLLTEVTTLFSLAPLLLATGPGAEVLRPMVVPVLGGLLVADEVIDLFLPVLFYRSRLRRLQLQAQPTK